ncbi:TPA: hypothetical protein DEP94_02895 [Candidatus Nomurabacteria bacterium]|nr:hypothetical protein [Candidatus Nomurabacteria bacterium]
MLTGSISLLLLAIIARTAYGLYGKYALNKLDSFSLYFFTNSFVALAVFPFIYKSVPSFFSLPIFLILAFILAGIAQAASGIVSNYALKNVPMTIYTTLSQFQVVWVVVFGIIFLSEKVTILSTFGTLLIIFSTILISGSTQIRKDIGLKPILICIISTLVSAAAILLDKVLVGTFNQLFYFFLMLLIPVIFLLPHYVRKYNFYNKQVKENLKVYFISSIFLASSYYSLLSLYSLPDIPLSVAYPIRSTSSIFIAILAVYIFNENKNIKRKIFATVIAVIGAILVKLA